MLSAPASRIAVCALRSDLAAISAVIVQSGNRTRKLMRGLSLDGLMALISAALRVVVTFSRAAVSAPGPWAAEGEGAPRYFWHVSMP
jgi:hypothetical protein